MEILLKTLKTGDFLFFAKFASNIPNNLFCNPTDKFFLLYSSVDSSATTKKLSLASGDSRKDYINCWTNFALRVHKHLFDFYKDFGGQAWEINTTSI